MTARVTREVTDNFGAVGSMDIPKRLCFDGRIAPGEHYYCVVIGGGGLGSMKFPRRVCVDCLGNYE